MQEAMVRQTNVSILPSFEVIIILEGDFEPESNIGGHAVRSRLELKNVGLGVALGIKIESIFVVSNSALYSWQPIKFKKINSLMPRQKQVVKDIQPFDVLRFSVGERRPDLLRRLVEVGTPDVVEGRTSEPELKIWFTDILGNKYVQVVHVGRSGAWSDVVQPDKGQVKRTSIIYNKVNWD